MDFTKLDPEVMKAMQEFTPEKIAERLISVQPMDDINLVELAEALENYVWICPIMAAAFNRKDNGD